MVLTLQELAQELGGEVCGDSGLAISDVAPVETAGFGQISYLDNKKQLKAAAGSQAGALLTTAELAAGLQLSRFAGAIVKVADPQAAFVTVMLKFRPLPQRAALGISERACVDPSAQLGPGCNVYPHAWIGAGVSIGRNCDIGPGVVIHDGCVIGDDCTLHAHAVLYRQVTLGDRVIIHANAVIGADGFGYRPVNGSLQRVPHTGTVLIEDDVEIGACSTIDRAMIGATVIGQGTKLDNLVMIAHNCQIGRHNALASQVGLAGSCTTGDYVQMGGQVGVADHLHIGAGSKFGGKAGVAMDMPAGGVYQGIPAIDIKEAIKNHFTIQKLPKLRDQVAELEQQLAELREQLNSSSSTAFVTPSVTTGRAA